MNPCGHIVSLTNSATIVCFETARDPDMAEKNTAKLLKQAGVLNERKMLEPESNVPVGVSVMLIHK